MKSLFAGIAGRFIKRLRTSRCFGSQLFQARAVHDWQGLHRIDLACVCLCVAGFLVNGCGAKLPPRMTPLKTKPAVDIPRGSEVRVCGALSCKHCASC